MSSWPQGRPDVGVHPIEQESYRILETRVDLSGFPPLSREVVARVLHASADLDYATDMVVDEAAVLAGIQALRSGAAVLVDVEMVRQGITAMESACYLGQAVQDDDSSTRSARGMSLAARQHPSGAVVVVGCAPTALFEVIRLADEGAFDPALVIGLPVGFVGAKEAKEELRRSHLVSLSNRSEKGGSAVAAAAMNAICGLAGSLYD